MGRTGKNDHTKSITLRFPPGLRERLDAMLAEGEGRTEVIQQLIIDEIERRERAQPDPARAKRKGEGGDG